MRIRIRVRVRRQSKARIRARFRIKIGVRCSVKIRARFRVKIKVKVKVSGRIRASSCQENISLSGKWKIFILLKIILVIIALHVSFPGYHVFHVSLNCINLTIMSKQPREIQLK